MRLVNDYTVFPQKMQTYDGTCQLLQYDKVFSKRLCLISNLSVAVVSLNGHLLFVFEIWEGLPSWGCYSKPVVLLC